MLSSIGKLRTCLTCLVTVQQHHQTCLTRQLLRASSAAVTRDLQPHRRYSSGNKKLADLLLNVSSQPQQQNSARVEPSRAQLGPASDDRATNHSVVSDIIHPPTKRATPFSSRQRRDRHRGSPADGDDTKVAWKHGSGVDLTEHAATFRDERSLTTAQWELALERVANAALASPGISHLLQSSPPSPTLCDSVIMKECARYSNYDLATSYLQHIEKHTNRELNKGTMALYLDICTAHEDCEESTILGVVERVSSGSVAMGAELSQRVVLALCRTAHWQQSYQHLSNIARQGAQIVSFVLEAMCCAAFRAGDVEAGWHFFDSLCARRPQEPIAAVCRAWLDRCAALSEDKARLAGVRELVQHMGELQVFPDAATADAIARVLQDQGWTMQHTIIGESDAKCRCCGTQLAFTPISEQDFSRLTSVFVERVLQRGDLYLRTTPAEWAHFQSFLTTHGPFTHVLDGLNISYNGSGKNKFQERNKSMAVQLLQVTDHLLREDPSARLLLVCREHMKGWHRPTMNALYQNTHLYFLKNLTSDDSYFLYSALMSGVNTKVITKDLLRDHVFLLGDEPLQRVFRLWQQRAQCPMQWGRPPLPAKAATHTTRSQVSSDGLHWHIPYDDGRLLYSYQLPTTWLCLTPPQHKRS